MKFNYFSCLRSRLMKAVCATSIGMKSVGWQNIDDIHGREPNTRFVNSSVRADNFRNKTDDMKNTSKNNELYSDME